MCRFCCSVEEVGNRSLFSELPVLLWLKMMRGKIFSFCWEQNKNHSFFPASELEGIGLGRETMSAVFFDIGLASFRYFSTVAEILGNCNGEF